jgi:protein NrfD
VILYLFLSHLGIGIFFTLALISREAGVKFFRFNAGLAAILIGFAFAFRPTDDTGAFATAAFAALIAAEAGMVLYWATVGRTLASVRPMIVWTTVTAGAIAVIAQGLAASANALASETLTIASFITSSALLGGACTAMVLGHWYLVIPSMQVSHLQSVVKLHIVSMVVRIAVVAAAVFVAIASWQPGLGPGPSFGRYILSIDGIFFWQRILFGLAAPVFLVYLTWETAKIRSTQSATGILYVDFFTIVVGEVLAKWVLLATRVPV